MRKLRLTIPYKL